MTNHRIPLGQQNDLRRAALEIIAEFAPSAVAVYKYLADCGGKWGALSYNFKDDTTEILLLAEWDTILSHRFAMRAVEHFRIHHNDKLPDKIVLTFIGPEQRSRRYDNKFEAGN